MPTSVDLSGKPFHFIGIGGIGMSALAYILAKRNLPIYGSDIKSSHITRRLEDLGVHIFWHQDASNFAIFQGKNLSDHSSTSELLTVGGVASHNGKGQGTPELPQVICSTAIQRGNSEYQAAVDLGCPIFHRSDLLAALIADYQSIAVAGTHGKTTTSSLIAYLLLEAGLDPSIVVGGEVNAWEGNARLGQGPYWVAEADESDGSLVKLKASIGVVTNVELDHPEHYQNLDQVISTFEVFEQNCQTLIGCWDCATVKEHLHPSITYSLQPDAGADYTVDQVEYHGEHTTARVWERGVSLGTVRLSLLGAHNLSNALAAIAVGRFLGLEFAVISGALGSFEGARRRFEHRGEHNGILFVDDYAHHPSEIQATLAAARLRVQSVPSDSQTPLTKSCQRIIAIFQPHRYSRTQAFLAEFAQSFQDADMVVISEIYSAGESNLGMITGQQVADLIANYQPHVYFQPSLEAMKQFLVETLRPGDLALFLGAGNLNQIIPDVMSGCVSQ